jgi:chemotaxis protein CheD
MQKIVSTGEVVLAHSNDTLAIYGLGSCIALVIYDESIHVGCMLHVLLPSSPEYSLGLDTRYADSGIKRMLNYLKFAGAKKANLKAKMTGGTHTFSKMGTYSDIGLRNARECRALLAEYNIRLVAEDVGGSMGRSVVFSINDMSFSIRFDNQLIKVI